MFAMHKFTSGSAMLCDVYVVLKYIRAHKPFNADEDDHTNVNAWVP